MTTTLTLHGLKSTPTREALLELFEQVHEPVDVPFLLAHVKKRGIRTDRATVFRNMNTFTQRGITRRVELGDGRSRYELASLPHHHHAVCIKCRTIIDIPQCGMSTIEQTIANQMQFTVISHNIEIYGTCAACS